jgi:RHS repeat-associated protein
VNPVSSSEGRRFTGQEREPETGLDYLGARYYASQSGRMTTVDPVLDLDQALLDPQRWNRYAYSLNNPLKFTDPDGRSPKLAIMALKAGHALYKGYDIYSTVAGIVDAGGTVVSADATIGERVWAGVQLAGELSGVMDLFKAGRGVLNVLPEGGFGSFGAFKRVFGRAGSGMDWHHVVEKHSQNLSEFGERQIHNIANLIRLDRNVHHRISAFYSAKQTFTDGLTFRDWLRGKSFAEQKAWGEWVLRNVAQMEK